MKNKYDVAAYIWPSYTGDEPRTRIFWSEGYGEWEIVKNATPKFEGHKWPRRPVWGYVNEADKNVMEMQIDAAADHGVNVFIYDWYWFDGRPFLENCLNDGYLKARNNDRVKFYLMWANHDVDYLWDKRNNGKPENALERGGLIYTGAVDRARFEEVGKRLIEKYFSHPSYYKIDGKPVFMIFSLPVMVRGLGGVQNTKAAFEWLKDECVKAGLGGLHLQMNIHPVCYHIQDENGKEVPIKELIDTLGFDSATNYQLIDLVKYEDDQYENAVDIAKSTWERTDANLGETPYFPQMSVGWDNNPRYKDIIHPILYNSTPEAFEKGIRNAKEYVDNHPNQPPLITINSWNEWTEGSYLEPDDVYGYKYLETVKKVFMDSEE